MKEPWPGGLTQIEINVTACLATGSSVVCLRKRGKGCRAAAQQLQLPLCCLLSPLPWPCPSSTRPCSHPGLPVPLCCCLFSCPVGQNFSNSFYVRDVMWCFRMPSVPPEGRRVSVYSAVPRKDLL